jgi:MFS family permease
MTARRSRPLVVARGLRGFADGFAAVLLARYLQNLGLSNFKIGVIVTATLLGSALLTLLAGLRMNHWAAIKVLAASCGLMALTGVGYATFTQFWPLVVVGFVGTLNPSAGDVSLFLPTEQAVMADLSDAHERPHRFAIYNLGGSLAGAAGALVSPLPDRLARNHGWDVVTVQRLSFLIYVVVGAACFLVYRGLRTHAEFETPRRGLHKSKAIVVRLSALFTLDSAGGGLVVTSLLVLYLDVRFDLSPAATGTTLAAAGVLTAFSQLASPRIAKRIGLVRTMVFTHIPANVFLILAGIVPSAPAAVTFLLLRAALSQMDVPVRQALVMHVVEPDERAAAASVTNVPRSLGAATTPALAGALLQVSSFGWPLVIGGVMKITYDLMLLAQPLDRS